MQETEGRPLGWVLRVPGSDTGILAPVAGAGSTSQCCAGALEGSTDLRGHWVPDWHTVCEIFDLSRGWADCRTDKESVGLMSRK